MSGSLLRSVLNLPATEISGRGETRDDGDTEARAGAGAPVTVPAPRSVAGFELGEEPTRHLWTRRLLRGLLGGLAVVLLLLGLKGIISPPARQVIQASDPRASFPAGQAQGVATRWSEAYLTLTANPAGADITRTAALALDTAAGIDVAGGWNGTGQQRVLTLIPAGVNVAGNGRSAIATVLAKVASTKNPAGSWVALAVPVGTDGTRAVVTGSPAFVGMPTPGPVLAQPQANTPPQDSAATAATLPGAQAFFRAYAGTDPAALSQASAPGARISPLGGVVTLASLDNWTVLAGNALTRQASASVTWSSANGATFKQTYTLTLTAISAAGASAWRVQSITAANG